MTGDPFVPRLKIYRKRRKSEGQTWSPDTDELDKAKLDKGPLCKTCRKTRRWNKLEIAYERLADGTIQRIMYCDGCGNALRTDEVGSTNTPLTRDNYRHSIITSTEEAPGKEISMGSEGGLSAKEAAIALGTDARTLRKFLRSSSSPFEPVGQGSRYIFDEKEMKRLKKTFVAWSGGSRKKEIETAQPKSDHVDDYIEDPINDPVLYPDEFADDLDALDGPSEDDLMEIEDLD